MDGEVVDHKNGTYEFVYVIPTEGDFSLALRLYDQHIKGSPFKLNVSRTADLQVRQVKGHTKVKGAQGHLSLAGPAPRCRLRPPPPPTRRPTPRRPRAPRRAPRGGASPRGRRRRAPRGRAAPWARHAARPTTPSRTTSSSRSVRRTGVAPTPLRGRGLTPVSPHRHQGAQQGRVHQPPGRGGVRLRQGPHRRQQQPVCAGTAPPPSCL